MSAIRDLCERWREEAGLLRRRLDARGADLLDQVAAELEQVADDRADEALTLTQAAELGGYSTRRLRELIQAGELDNVGRKGAPRIRRADVPSRKKKRRTATMYDPHADARAVAGRIGRQ